MGKRPVRPARRTGAWREFDLIARIRSLAGSLGPGDCLGIGDDASAYQPRAGAMELVTCDALVEGVHWDWAWCDPEALGRKAAAVNLSDIAAMGGTPQRAYLVLALPPRAATAQVLGVVRGVVDELRQYGARLAGGDTNASPGPMMISLTLQGSVLKSQMLCRRGARPGDWLMVTGDLGAAAAGLLELRHAARPQRCESYAVHRLRRPVPRLAEGRWLAKSGKVSAMLDVSDGLAGDVRRLCEASGVGARLVAEHLPIAQETRRVAGRFKRPAWSLALHGGEDYELLFAVRPADAPGLCSALKNRLGTRCTWVGQVTRPAQGLTLELPQGKIVPLPRGWEHNGPEGA